MDLIVKSTYTDHHRTARHLNGLVRLAALFGERRRQRRRRKAESLRSEDGFLAFPGPSVTSEKCFFMFSKEQKLSIDPNPLRQPLSPE